MQKTGANLVQALRDSQVAAHVDRILDRSQAYSGIQMNMLIVHKLMGGVDGAELDRI